MCGVMLAATGNNTTLRFLDLSCNVISEDGGWQIKLGLAQNTTLQNIDLRLNQVSLTQILT